MHSLQVWISPLSDLLQTYHSMFIYMHTCWEIELCSHTFLIPCSMSQLPYSDKRKQLLKMTLWDAPWKYCPIISTNFLAYIYMWTGLTVQQRKVNLFTFEKMRKTCFPLHQLLDSLLRMVIRWSQWLFSHESRFKKIVIAIFELRNLNERENVAEFAV